MKSPTVDVRLIARLANLTIAEEKLALYEKELAAILDFVNKLQNVDTTKVQPTSQVTGLGNIFREDRVKPSLSQAEALSNCPRTHQGYFISKAVLE